MAEKARYAQRTQKNRHAQNRHPNNKKSKKANAVIWLLLIAIFAGGAVFFVSQFKKDNQDKVQKVAYPQKYSKYVDKASLQYSLDPALIYAVIHTESGFNPNAESPAGACGLMQVMPDSFDWLMGLRGESDKYTTEDLFNRRSASTTAVIFCATILTGSIRMRFARLQDITQASERLTSGFRTAV